LVKLFHFFQFFQILACLPLDKSKITRYNKIFMGVLNKDGTRSIMFQSRFSGFSKTVDTQRFMFLKNQKNTLRAENHRSSAEIFNTFIYQPV